MQDVKSRLKDMYLRQVWLIDKLRERGISVDPGNFSRYINGVVQTEYGYKLLSICHSILDAEEKRRASRGA